MFWDVVIVWLVWNVVMPLAALVGFVIAFVAVAYFAGRK